MEERGRGYWYFERRTEAKDGKKLEGGERRTKDRTRARYSTVGATQVERDGEGMKKRGARGGRQHEPVNRGIGREREARGLANGRKRAWMLGSLGNPHEPRCTLGTPLLPFQFWWFPCTYTYPSSGVLHGQPIPTVKALNSVSVVFSGIDKIPLGKILHPLLIEPFT